MARLASASLLIFFVALIGYSFALPLVQRDVSQLELDLELFFGDTAGLSNSISNLDPTPSRIQPHIAGLPGQFALTDSDLQQCITDIHEIPSINRVDAHIVLKMLQDFEPTILGMLHNIRHKKRTFQKLHMVPFILGQLETLRGGVSGLLGSLITVVPPQLQGVAKSLQANMGSAFQQTISHF